MSTKYPGGLITKNPVTPAGPYETGAAPGVWTVEQALQYTKQGIWPIAGNQDPTNIYIEYLFQTYLYTGNGSTQTITNGIDLSGKGGMVWLKDRSSGQNHALSDTVRGTGSSKQLQSNTTSAATTDTLTGFTSSGFTLDASFGIGAQNLNTVTYASWTFRKQPKFFDVVTYTGNGTAGRQIAHNLGSTPGFLVVKNTATSGTDWDCWHRSIPTSFTVLNATYAANAAGAAYFGNGSTAISPTSTVFTVSDALDVNASGQTYVAYLFAHDAGGFGLTGTDNVISCGSYTTDGSGNFSVNLGYEPQWIMVKRTSSTGNWLMFDNMRGLGVDGTSYALYADLSNAEAGPNSFMSINSTGFGRNGGTAGQTWIYIAIRRGPMKVPTSGTSVFSPTYGLSASNSEFVNAGFPIDLNWRGRTTGDNVILQDRLRAADNLLFSNLTDAEANTGGVYKFTTQNGCTFTSTANFSTWINWSFRRAPSFFDEVCYTGTGSATTFAHNLGAVPELMIVKERSSPAGWWWNVYYGTANKFLKLNTTDAETTSTAVWNNTAPTSSVFSVGAYNPSNTSGSTYVAYLFASCAGVSKVGSYTGTGATQTINCGFSAGARWVMIKRTDSTGDWYVWDSARGIVSGNDPYLLLNSTAAEVTGTDYVDTYSAGFEISSTAPSAINASGGTFIFLAIA